MDPSPRKTRAQTKQLQQPKIQEPTPTPNPPSTSTPSPAKPPQPIYHQAPNLASFSPRPNPIPLKPSNRFTKLSPAEHTLLLHKQALLAQQAPTLEASIPKSFQKHSSTIQSTLVFVREEAGTAVVIRGDGLLLTCAHCVAETRDEFDAEHVRDKIFWLLLSSGRLVSARCVAWDPVRDLALLGVTAVAEFGFSPNVVSSGTAASTSKNYTAGENAEIKVPTGTPKGFALSHVSLAESSPALDAMLLCVGHPGAEDLETSRRGVKTGYDVLHVSTGAFRGIAEGQDVQDNEDIGALMHDCWTYWGHSGAPLLDRKTGKLVGLHSSWDDETGMRRGVAIEAIWEFLGLCGVELGSLDSLMGR